MSSSPPALVTTVPGLTRAEPLMEVVAGGSCPPCSRLCFGACLALDSPSPESAHTVTRRRGCALDKRPGASVNLPETRLSALPGWVDLSQVTNAKQAREYDMYCIPC